MGEEGEGVEDERGSAEGALGEADVVEGAEVGVCFTDGAAVGDEGGEGADVERGFGVAYAALLCGGDAREEGLDVGLGEIGLVAGEVEVVGRGDFGGGGVGGGLGEEDVVVEGIRHWALGIRRGTSRGGGDGPAG
ncbi:MAG: hypothetical protein ACF8R7_18880 [Phycisphaerales bacterium JB039]